MNSELTVDPRDLIYNDQLRHGSVFDDNLNDKEVEPLLRAIYPRPCFRNDRTSKTKEWLVVYGSNVILDIPDIEGVDSFKQELVESFVDLTYPENLSDSFYFDISAALATIRSHFSLQIKELALILGVQRPTIYSWMRDESKPQPDNRHRISQILRFVSYWQNLGGKPLGDLVRNHFDEQGRTLLDLFSQNPLDESQINFHMSRLASVKPVRPARLSEIAKREGIDLSKVAKSDLEFDVLTGRSFDEE